MSTETKAFVIDLLESYQKRAKQIELLHYELAHPIQVTASEMIGALALTHSDEGDGRHPGDHASDKTLYIALNYQERTDQLNNSVSKEIVEQLVTLEQEQERLKYYVSLLIERQTNVIRLTYFEGCTQEDVAERLKIAKRTVQLLKAQAIEALAAMYDYTMQLR